MNINWQWTPGVSLGPIFIGSDIFRYIESYGAVRTERELGSDPSEWDTYILPGHDDIYIDVSDGKIVSITSHFEFKYKGENIIGVPVGRVMQILGSTADEVGESVSFDDGDVQTPYDFFDLGLQLWASSGIVVSATCLSYDEDGADPEVSPRLQVD